MLYLLLPALTGTLATFSIVKNLPDIVLIIMDTAAAKHFSFYGHHKRISPYLDRIAEESMIYRRCFSPAHWTIPSYTSLFTGLYPSEYGIKTNFALMDNRCYFLAEILKSSGYKTFGISGNGIVYSVLSLTDRYIYSYVV